MKTFVDLSKEPRNSLDNEKFLIIYRLGNYCLIYRYTSFQPWVVANGLHAEEKYWNYGHYFSELRDAVEYIHLMR